MPRAGQVIRDFKHTHLCSLRGLYLVFIFSPSSYLFVFIFRFFTVLKPLFYIWFSRCPKESDKDARPRTPAGGREWECTKIRVARPVPGFRLFPIFCLPFSLPFFHLIPALMHLFFSFLLPFFCFFLNRAVWAASIGTVLLILYEYESGLRSGVHGVVRFVHSGFEVCCDCQ